MKVKFVCFNFLLEDLYTGMIENFVRATPALWDEFAMRLESGEYYLVDPDPFAPTPTVPTSENICLDIHNNVKFSNQNYAFGPLNRSWNQEENILLKDNLLSSASRN